MAKRLQNNSKNRKNFEKMTQNGNDEKLQKNYKKNRWNYRNG